MVRFNNNERYNEEKKKKSNNSNFPFQPDASRLISLAIVVLLGYLLFRAWSAEMIFRRAMAVAPQNGVLTYNLMLDVLRKNPYNPLYRRAQSQVELALANVLSRPQQNQASPSAQTVRIVRQLVVQSVNDAKSAVNLSPLDPSVWTNLASIYRALIGVANGAED